MSHILWAIILWTYVIMIWYLSWDSPESYIQGKNKVWQPRYYEANHNEKDGLVYTITPLIWNCHDRGQCHYNFYVTKINYLHYIIWINNKSGFGVGLDLASWTYQIATKVTGNINPKNVFSESKLALFISAASMLVVNNDDKMCWWQLRDVGDRKSRQHLKTVTII